MEIISSGNTESSSFISYLFRSIRSLLLQGRSLNNDDILIEFNDSQVPLGAAERQAHNLLDVNP